MKLTQNQLKLFLGKYLVDEMDMIFKTTNDDIRHYFFNTEDPQEIFERLKEGVKDIKTQEDLIEAFGDKYADIVKEDKMTALAKAIDVNVEDIKQEYENYFIVGSMEYQVVKEEERESLVKEEISESLWAFKPSFLGQMTGLGEEVFETLAELCESANGAVMKLIEGTCGMDEFVKKAVEADGYGHFIARYDGDEIELEGNLFAYRCE